MYSVGELILYSKTGVCRVDALEEKALSPGEKTRPYYILHPLFQSGRIFVPVEHVENGTIFTRPIMRAEQARAFIQTLPSLNAEPYYNQNLAQLKDYYRRQMQAPSCQDLALLLRSIYRKRQATVGKNRKLSVVDREFMEDAENLLYGELAAALGIRREEVQAYIDAALSGR